MVAASDILRIPSGVPPDVAIYSDVAPFAGNHFNCFRLLRRSVILYGTGKATAPIEGRDVRPSGESPQLAALLANGFAREAESNERLEQSVRSKVCNVSHR
jgi:hypothetical protein